MKKMPTIFVRNFENMREITAEQHPDCGWVFKNKGTATRKYDGTCTMIKDGKFFKRREVKKGKDVPENFTSCGHDEKTGKRMGWVPVTASNEDATHMEALSNLREHIDGTYELVGPKVQRNPEKTGRHILLKHSDAEIFKDVPLCFKGIKEWLSDKDIEGIVFHHPDGRMAKIKKRDFGLNR